MRRPPPSRTESNAIVSELIDYFAKFPSLVIEQEFPPHEKSKTRATPLHCFLQNGRVDNVHLLEEFCRRLSWETFHQLLSRTDPNGDFHYACRYSSGPVIEFLAAQGEPNLLAQHGKSGRRPFVLAMYRRDQDVPVSTLQVVFDLSPTADASILSYSIRNSLPIDLLEKITKALPVTDFLKLNLTSSTPHAPRLPFPINLELCDRVLCKILSKITTLHLAVWDWETDAFVRFMDELKTNETIRNIQYLTVPSLSGKDEKDRHSCISSLRQTLSEGTMPLQHIHLEASDFYDGFLLAMELNQVPSCLVDSLKSLELQWNAGISYSITRANRSEETPSEALTVNPTAIGLRLKGNIGIFILSRILVFFESLTSLSLHSGYTGQSGLTNPFFLSQMLQLKSLRRLHLVGFYLDLVVTCAKLQRNTTLTALNLYESFTNMPRQEEEATCLDLLVNHNVTLTEMMPFETKYDTVAHYLHLNRMGRARVRLCQVVGSEEWIQLLLAPRTDVQLSRTRKFRDGVVYGLLREVPGLWCYRSCFDIGIRSSRKRLSGRALHGVDRIVPPTCDFQSPLRQQTNAVPMHQQVETAIEWVVPPCKEMPEGLQSPVHLPVLRRSKRLMNKKAFI